jgi:tetratricopeptide (TPR) repeat protein
MYKTGEYLFNANDVLFLEIMTKIVFFTEVFKYALADIYNTEGNYYKSIKILKNCRKNDSYFLLANNYEKINKYEKAAESYTKILLNDKNERPDVLYNRGANYKYLGKYDEAINDFIACIKCRKPDPKAYIALGVIKDELGEYEEAKEYFLKGKVLDNSFNGYIPEKYRSVN